MERKYLLVATWNPRSVRRYDAATLGFVDIFAKPSASPGIEGAFEFLTGLAFGPDGHLYVADWKEGRVLRFRHGDGGTMGDFVTKGSGGLVAPGGLTFGPDGHLYVSSRAFLGGDNPAEGEILRYHGKTGAFLGAFVSAQANGGLTRPYSPIFGADGHLYVCEAAKDEILRYDGQTGAFLGAFVPAKSGGLHRPLGQCFGPDGNLYVNANSQVLRFDGATGDFLDVFVTMPSTFLAVIGIAFDAHGRLHVANDSEVLVFSSTGQQVDSLMVVTNNLYLPTTLVFGNLPIPLAEVPELSQRVPRWLQVIGLIMLVATVVRLLTPVNRQRR